MLAGGFTALLAVTYAAFVRTEWGQAVDDGALAGREIEPQQLIVDAWHHDRMSRALLILASVLRKPGVALSAFCSLLGEQKRGCR
jgi:hypothetical protein